MVLSRLPSTDLWLMLAVERTKSSLTGDFPEHSLIIQVSISGSFMHVVIVHRLPVGVWPVMVNLRAAESQKQSNIQKVFITKVTNA